LQEALSGPTDASRFATHDSGSHCRDPDTPRTLGGAGVPRGGDADPERPGEDCL